MTTANMHTSDHAHGVRAGWVLAGDDAASVARARARAVAALAPYLPTAVLDDVALAVSELAGNAIRHSASGRPGGRFAVAVWLRSGGVRVAVLDQGGPTAPRVADAEQLADPLAEGGRGLGTLARLGAVGWDDAPMGLRRVWTELPCGGTR